MVKRSQTMGVKQEAINISVFSHEKNIFFFIKYS